MKTMKWIFGILLAGVAGCACIVALLLYRVDPNDFKPQIVNAVRENTGRELSIPGKLDLEFFPYLALTISDLELGNSQGFDGPFLQLRNASLKVRLLPLFFSRLEVVATDVDGLSLFLMRDKDGRGNWMDLATPSSGEASPAPEPALARDKRVPLLASLIVEGLQVTNARVVWHDELKGHDFDVHGIRLDVSDFAFGAPFAVDTGAAGTINGVDGELELSAKAVLELDRLNVDNLSLTALLRSSRFPQSPETLSLTADSFSTDGSLVNGHLQGFGLDFRFTTHESSEGAAGRIDVTGFDPHAVAGRLGMNFPAFIDPSALQHVAFGCDWRGNRKRVDVSGLRLALDNSTLQGEVSWQNEAEAVSFDLKADNVDLDRYRLQEGDAAAHESGQKRGGLPKDTLRALNAEGALAADSLKVAGLRFTAARVKLRAAKGRFQLESLDADAYGGHIRGAGSMDVRSEPPAYTWTQDVKGLMLGPLLHDLHGADSFSGTAQSTASLRARGDDFDAIKKSLDGKLDFRVVDGAIHGVNIAQQLRDGIRKLKGLPPGPAEPPRTAFSLFSGSGNISSGVETSRDLLLVAPRFRINGAGQADLVRESLDYKLVITLEGSEGAFDEGVLGISNVPVRVSGPMRQPTITPDVEAVLRSLGLGGKVVRDVLKGVGTGLGNGLEGLKNIFGKP